MKTFETILKSESSTIIRVKAETPLQARMLLAEFMEGADGQDYNIRKDVNLLRGYTEGTSNSQ